jgi:hypothetical protein
LIRLLCGSSSSAFSGSCRSSSSSRRVCFNVSSLQQAQGVSELKGPGLKRKAHWRWAFMYSKRCLMAFLMALSVTCAVAFQVEIAKS